MVFKVTLPNRLHGQPKDRSTLLNCGLFTRDFLIEGIGNEGAWQRLDDAALNILRDKLSVLLASFGKLKTPTEPETEKELIWPLLEALGWSDILIQQNLSSQWCAVWSKHCSMSERFQTWLMPPMGSLQKK